MASTVLYIHVVPTVRPVAVPAFTVSESSSPKLTAPALFILSLFPHLMSSKSVPSKAILVVHACAPFFDRAAVIALLPIKADGSSLYVSKLLNSFGFSPYFQIRAFCPETPARTIAIITLSPLGMY